jgi:hypothetical protein
VQLRGSFWRWFRLRADHRHCDGRSWRRPRRGKDQAHTRRGMNNRGSSSDAHTFAACRRRSMGGRPTKQRDPAEPAVGVGVGVSVGVCLCMCVCVCRAQQSRGVVVLAHSVPCAELICEELPPRRPACAGGQRRDYLIFTQPVRTAVGLSRTTRTTTFSARRGTRCPL